MEGQTSLIFFAKAPASSVLLVPQLPRQVAVSEAAVQIADIGLPAQDFRHQLRRRHALSRADHHATFDKFILPPNLPIILPSLITASSHVNGL